MSETPNNNTNIIIGVSVSLIVIAIIVCIVVYLKIKDKKKPINNTSTQPTQPDQRTAKLDYFVPPSGASEFKLCNYEKQPCSAGGFTYLCSGGGFCNIQDENLSKSYGVKTSNGSKMWAFPNGIVTKGNLFSIGLQQMRSLLKVSPYLKIVGYKFFITNTAEIEQKEENSNYNTTITHGYQVDPSIGITNISEYPLIVKKVYIEAVEYTWVKDEKPVLIYQL